MWVKWRLYGIVDIGNTLKSIITQFQLLGNKPFVKFPCAWNKSSPIWNLWKPLQISNLKCLLAILFCICPDNIATRASEKFGKCLFYLKLQKYDCILFLDIFLGLCETYPICSRGRDIHCTGWHFPNYRGKCWGTCVHLQWLWIIHENKERIT